MTSTYSTSLRLELMATGDQSGTWGDTTNTNLGTLLEQAITGVLSLAMADANQTLTNLNGASDQARNAVIVATGALTAGRNIVVPAVNKVYLVRNSTTGGFSVTVKTPSGTGIAVIPGTARLLYCDGTNVADGNIDLQTLSTTALSPTTTDGLALGTTSLMWSDLFLASGGVINWNNGNFTVTHSTGLLTFSGAIAGTTFNKVTVTAPATGSTLTIADGKTLTVSNSLALAGSDSTTMTFPSTSSTVLTTGNTATITKGYSVTPNNIGTVSSGTTTPDPANGNYQYYTNNGAHTLAAPSSDCAIDVLVTNGASAGAITFSGFTVGSSTGSALTTTNTNKFIISIRRINAVATYSIYALQ